MRLVPRQTPEHELAFWPSALAPTHVLMCWSSALALTRPTLGRGRFLVAPAPGSRDVDKDVEWGPHVAPAVPFSSVVLWAPARVVLEP